MAISALDLISIFSGRPKSVHRLLGGFSFWPTSRQVPQLCPILKSFSAFAWQILCLSLSHIGAVSMNCTASLLSSNG